MLIYVQNLKGFKVLYQFICTISQNFDKKVILNLKTFLEKPELPYFWRKSQLVEFWVPVKVKSIYKVIE